MSDIKVLIFGKQGEVALLVSECNMQAANGEKSIDCPTYLKSL